VVLLHEEPDRLHIEIHIVVSRDRLAAPLQIQEITSVQHPFLPQLAEQIRITVQQELAGVHLLPQAIDVVMEDAG
jgi:hypothetical protein